MYVCVVCDVMCCCLECCVSDYMFGMCRVCRVSHVYVNLFVYVCV